VTGSAGTRGGGNGGPRRQAVVRPFTYLADHLGHDPERLRLTLETGERVSVTHLLDSFARHAFPVTGADLEEFVERNDKRRLVETATKCGRTSVTGPAPLLLTTIRTQRSVTVSPYQAVPVSSRVCLGITRSAAARARW
jgi:hypothetical protein